MTFVVQFTTIILKKPKNFEITTFVVESHNTFYAEKIVFKISMNRIKNI